MELVRLDPIQKLEMFQDDHRQSGHQFNKKEDEIFRPASIVIVPFGRFGRGEQKRSDFTVEVTWPDIRGLVAAFIEMQHPEALHLERILKLAGKIENAGWSPNDPPDEDFWEMLPE